LVSIVTPSYNQGRYIGETVRSVLSQDYPRIEYIVVDGGSTDATAEILRQYQGRLAWISEKDRGQADAINKGFRRASGEILGWLNSDDAYLPGAVSKAVKYLRARPDVGLVYGEAHYIDAAGRILGRYPSEPLDLQRLAEVCFICQPAVFFRAEVFRRVGPLDVRLQYCLDYDYWIRAARQFPMEHLGEYLANSRLHAEAKTVSRRADVYAEILGTVKRHYGSVPATWISGYVDAYLRDVLGIPQEPSRIAGLHGDGWASPHLRVILPPRGRPYSYVAVRGRVSPHAHPVTLRIATGHQVVTEAALEAGTFSLKGRLPARQAEPPEGLEVVLDADGTFVPRDLGTGAAARPLSYRIEKLWVGDDGGGELVLYSGWRARLFHLALPLLFRLKHLAINHRLPEAEPWKRCP
jgi:hypothetical protein